LCSKLAAISKENSSELLAPEKSPELLALSNPPALGLPADKCVQHKKLELDTNCSAIEVDAAKTWLMTNTHPKGSCY
jgi:hypothetical protein